MAVLCFNLSSGQKQIGFYQTGLAINRRQMKGKLEIGHGGPGSLSRSGRECYFSSWRGVATGREEARRELPVITCTQGSVGSGRVQIQSHAEALEIAGIASDIKFELGWSGEMDARDGLGQFAQPVFPGARGGGFLGLKEFPIPNNRGIGDRAR